MTNDGLNCRAFPPKNGGKGIIPGSDTVVVAQGVHVYGEMVGLEIMTIKKDTQSGSMMLM